MKYRNVITASDFGPMIINRNDSVVGINVSEFGYWEKGEITLLKDLINRQYPGASNLSILDIGANIGIYSLAFSKMDIAGLKIYSIEAQRLIFYMLAGTMALNSCDNVYLYHAAASNTDDGFLEVQIVNFDVPANYGAFELIEPFHNKDFNGATLDEKEQIALKTIDSLNAENVALIKIDVEGMEDKALEGALKTIELYRPIIFFEYHKTDYNKIKLLLKKFNYALQELPAYNAVATRAESQLVISGFDRIVL